MVTPADAQVARTAQYRSGKAASGYISTGRGTYDAVLLEPSGGDTLGYANGAGIVASPAQPGLLDVTKPWLMFKHNKADGTLGCFSMANITKVSGLDDLVPNTYLLIDQTTTTKEALVVARIACADGTDSEVTAVWYKPANANAPAQFAWTFEFSGGSGDPIGAATIHGIDHDAYFWVCGDVSPCAKPIAQTYWRVYDANLTLTR